MRIAVKANHITHGGGLTHYNYLAEQFARLKPDWEFLVLATPSQKKLFNTGLPNVTFTYYDTPAKNLLSKMYWEKFRLPRIINDLRPDLLYVPGIYSSSKLNVPIVTLVHNIAPFSRRYIATETLFQRFRLNLLKFETIKSLQQSNGIIFLSNYTRRYCHSYYDSSNTPNIRAYHGTPETGTTENDNTILKSFNIESSFILSVSHIYRYKNIKEMIQAYYHADKQISLPPLYIAGSLYDKNYVSDLKKVIGTSHAPDKVILLGNLTESFLQVLYRNAQLFLFPSSLENCPNILIEAMANGCPIISSNKTVMPEITGYKALYAHPTDVKKTASHIINVMNNNKLRDQLKQNSLQQADKYSWQKTASDMISFFEQFASPQKSYRAIQAIAETNSAEHTKEMVLS